jgi:tetratricopeptide (TPR) repeat protein
MIEMRRVDSKFAWAAAIFLGAVVLRVIYFYQVKADFPGWDTPTIDPLYHDLWARQIASGDLLGSGPFFRAPLYAYFLGLIYAIFGPSLAAAKIIQHLVGAITCSVLFLFADRNFGRKVAVLSGIIAAFNWVLIFHEDELLLDSLLVLFSVVMIWAMIRGAERKSAAWFLISGLLLGLACITRPNYLAFLPVIPLWLLTIWRRDYGRIIKSFGFVVLGCALLILPVTLRNAIVGHDAVLIASQGGINFYIGNNRYADGASAVMPEFGATWQYSDAEYLAKRVKGRLGREMKQSQVSSFYYKRGIDFISHEPTRWLGLMVKKLDFFWNGFEISNNQNLYFYRRFASITKILPPLFFVISPLSLIGIYLVFRQERKYHIIVYFLLVYMLTVIAFFVNSRFRLPVLPFLIILASVTFWKIADLFINRHRWAAIKYVIAALILLVLTNIDFFGISRESFAMSHYSLGNVYLKKGLNDEALEEYAAALSMADCVPKAHLNRGVIFFGRNDYAAAEREFNLELEKCGVSPEAHNNLSVLKRLEGRYDEALSEAQAAVAARPQYFDAYANEILALRMLGRRDEAFATADSLVSIFPEYMAGHYFRGLILAERGSSQDAEKELRTIISESPRSSVEKYDLSTIYSRQAGYGYRPERVLGLANYELGLLQVRAGQIDSATTYFRKAVESLPDYADAWANLALAYDHKKMYGEALEAFKKAIGLNPEYPLLYYNYGLTLGKLGRFTDAVSSFRRALDLKPGFKEAREKLLLSESLIDSAAKK